MAFFDANKTGQLVNRLTADIQEFKSSFKLVISQVLCATSVSYIYALKLKPFNSFLFCRVFVALLKQLDVLSPSTSSPQN